MSYDEWFADFITDKKLIAEFNQSTTHAAHSIRRYVGSDNKVWETGFTYTERLVLREGIIQNDGMTIEWNGWKTRHDVELPRH